MGGRQGGWWEGGDKEGREGGRLLILVSSWQECEVGSQGYWVCVGADNGGRKAGREQCEQGTERGKPEMERGWKKGENRLREEIKLRQK